jgi:hypothetical protein
MTILQELVACHNEVVCFIIRKKNDADDDGEAASLGNLMTLFILYHEFIVANID